MHAPLQTLEARAPALVEGDDLPVEHRFAGAELRAERAQLGIARADVVQVAALDPQLSRPPVGDRAHAVPLDLKRPPRAVGGQAPRAREHRHELLGHPPPSVFGWGIHTVDHPVLPLRLKQRVLPPYALAVEGDDHLVVAELVAVVGARVPDLHLAGAVAAGGDLTREVDVAERMVLDVDGEVVALRIVRDALGHRPGDEHAVALESQIPVQAARVVLLHDEAGSTSGAVLAPHGLGRVGESSFGVVLAERAFCGHRLLRVWSSAKRGVLELRA